MLFSSIPFLYWFLPAVIGVYFLVPRVLKNTVLLGLANLPRTLALGFVNTAAVFLCVRFILPLFFLPALAALLGSLFLEPMFKPYMPAEEPESRT